MGSRSRCMKILSFTLVLTLSFLSGAFAQNQHDWTVGAASSVITPEEPMYMAGYGGRTTPSEGTETDLFAKVLYLEAANSGTGLIITLDVLGTDKTFGDDLCKRLKAELQLDRNQIAICSSHTHSGPVVGKNAAALHYWTLEKNKQQALDTYEETLKQKIIAAAIEAKSNAVPARVQIGSGKSTFAVNRRNNKPEATVPEMRERGTLVGPVDHDVPVLTARNKEDKVIAVLFGYACHATVLGLNFFNGDYPGYAQTALEEQYPGATALFWAGCGGDQNPLPRKKVELAEKYGAELAEAVTEVISAPMKELSPFLKTGFKIIDAPLAPVPNKEQIEASKTSSNRFEVARAKYLLNKMEKQGPLKTSYPYPIGRWKLGGTLDEPSVDFIFLGGEVVVDYAVRLKKERNGTGTWVAGYSNDVMGYIPSLRVLKEGGYEGGGSNVYYGLPSLWAESIEETIIKAVHEGN